MNSAWHLRSHLIGRALGRGGGSFGGDAQFIALTLDMGERRGDSRGCRISARAAASDCEVCRELCLRNGRACFGGTTRLRGGSQLADLDVKYLLVAIEVLACVRKLAAQP